MSPARHGRHGETRARRLPALVVVAALVAAGVTLGRVAARPGPVTGVQPAVVADEAAPAGAGSSSWYCSGGTGPATPTAESTLVLVNPGSRSLRATLSVVDDKGAHGSASLLVPAHGAVHEVPGTVVPGTWLAASVLLSGGGVTVSEVVSGPSGWAITPCATETSPTWYFASGSTALGNAMTVSLFNPSAALAVVDLSFVTPGGLVQPQPFQGVVLEPGATTSLTVGTYVQDERSVATEVSARSGAVVATELEAYGAGGLSGLSLRLGAPQAATTWDLPRSENQTGGASQLVVLNPTADTERVTVDVALVSGPVAPFVAKVAAGAVWALTTSAELRIPAGTDYALHVTATGGPGVVVERDEASAVGAAAPQWGVSDGVSAAAEAPTRHWVVPSPAASGVAAAQAPLTVVLQNPGRRGVWVTLSTLTTPAGRPHPRRVRLAGRSFLAVPGGPGTVLVGATGPIAVAGDGSAGAQAGIVTVAAVPLS